MQTLLSTKKLKPNQRELVLNAGLSFVDYNAIQVEPLPFTLPRNLEHILITSQNSVRAILKSGLKIDKNLKFYCVGEKTATLLKSYGGQVTEIATSGYELATIIVDKYKAQSFVYFCAQGRLDTLPELLKENSVSLQEIPVYQTIFNKQPFERTFDAVLFYSPSGVQSFVGSNYPEVMASQEQSEAKATVITTSERIKMPVQSASIINTKAVCIGNTTAEAASRYFYTSFVANQTTVESVIAKAVKILHT